MDAHLQKQWELIDSIRKNCRKECLSVEEAAGSMIRYFEEADKRVAGLSEAVLDALRLMHRREKIMDDATKALKELAEVEDLITKNKRGLEILMEFAMEDAKLDPGTVH